MTPKFKNKLLSRVLIGILLIAFLLRIYKFQQLFYYNHDQDLIGWFIRDVLENRHFRLIGQETSNPGVFIGPLFYYLIIPFYLLFNMNPLGAVFLSVLIGIFSVFSCYFVFKKIFSTHIGFLAAFIYAVSSYTVFTDREVVPTTTAMLWSIWYLYSLFLLLKGEQKKGFLLAGLLFGLIWHINLALAILSPLVVLALFLSRKSIDLKAILIGATLAVVLSLPLIFFETRHNFQQVNSIIASLTTDRGHVEGTGRGLAKLDRLFQLIYKNTTNLFYPVLGRVRVDIAFWTLVVGGVVLLRKKIINKNLGLVMIFWQLLFIVFFALNPINISEYYINGMNVVWIGIFSLLLYQIYKSKYKKVALFLLILFFVVNTYKVLTVPVNASGYLQRREIAKYIKKDSLEHGYPCVSISYIVSPGNDLGYRYFYYLEKLHVNQPKSGSPVYTIVFPHSKVDKIDKSFGALGLIFPEYQKYQPSEVTQSCSGENANLTDPMFGFTK